MHRKPLALGVGEADSVPTKHFQEHPVLLAQVVDRVLLLAVHPPGKRHENQFKCVHREIVAASRAASTLRIPIFAASSTC